MENLRKLKQKPPFGSLVFLRTMIGLLLCGALMLDASGDAHAASCDDVGGTIVGTECQISGEVTASGNFLLPQTLHILTGGVIIVSPETIGLTIDIAGDLIMDTGSKIDGDVTGNDLIGAAIAINATGNIILHGDGVNGAIITAEHEGSCTPPGMSGSVELNANSDDPSDLNGDLTIQPGSEISVDATGCPAGEIILTGVNIRTGGNIHSESQLTGTGASQRPGGGPITLQASCNLTVSNTGVVRSKGRDPGADLVHLGGGCEVRIEGLVESTGPAHSVPDSPPNHCNNTNRPDKPANSTACIEVWAGDALLIDNSGSMNGEVNADTAQSGGHQIAWIDLVARGDITIKNDNSDSYAVHANEENLTNSTGGIITVRSRDGRVTTSNNAIQANATRPGSQGGTVIVEAGSDLIFGMASIQAKGANSGGGAQAGGTISAQSNGKITGNAPGELNADGGSGVKPGTVTLQGCSMDYTGTVTPAPATIFLVCPAIDLEKLVNDQDADTCPGPTVAAGSVVTYTYKVTNTGTTMLDHVTITDDVLGLIGTIPILTPGQTVSLTQTGPAPAAGEQLRNLGTVSAMPQGSGNPVADSDPACVNVPSGNPNHPPTITSTPVTIGTVSQLYTYDVEATDPNEDPLTYTLVTAPEGMTIDQATGLIQWIPTTAQEQNVEVRVEDGHGGSTTQLFSVTVTPCGNGVVDPGEQCDDRNTNGGDCCSSSCQFETNGSLCTDSNACTQIDQCNGAGQCVGVNVPVGTPCGGSDADCDALDTCDGSGSCIDRIDPSGALCRSANGVCDPSDICDGVKKSCPATVASVGTPCGGSDADCDAPDTCDGGGSCIDRFDPAGSECRMTSGECDIRETCTGTSSACPPNGFQPVGTSCLDDGDRCTQDRCDAVGSCIHPPQPPACGNGCPESGEACDDGNQVNNDGCTNACTLPKCGDGILQGTEQCDDGNIISGDGCEADCQATPIDVAITKSATPSVGVIAGRLLTYTLRVQNLSTTATATNIEVTDLLPEGAIFYTCVSSQGSCGKDGGTVRAPMGALLPQAEATITLVVTAPTGEQCRPEAPLTNTATVTAPGDVNLSNNTDTVLTSCSDVEVEDPDVIILQPVLTAPNPVRPGGLLTYTLLVQNIGAGNADSVTVTDSLPAGMRLEACISSHGSCELDNGVVQASLGTLVPQAVATVVLVVTAPPQCSTSITNTATVLAPGDSDLNNNAAVATTPCIPPPLAPDPTLVKLATPNPVTPGEVQTYVLFAQNQGADTASNVEVNDSLPTGIIFDSCTTSQGTCNEANGTVRAVLGALDSGKLATITLRVRTPNSAICTDFANTATVTTLVDDNPNNNAATVTARCAVCGNNIPDPDEQCDDGNTTGGDGCSATCQRELCGNGSVDQPSEQCDDGNQVNNDGCTNACTLPTCGDGIRQGTEQCDDGNTNNSDACRNNCTLPVPPPSATCGNGSVDQPSEQCDDGNQVNNDGCTNACTLPTCGDGIRQGIEQCDDGNTNNSDTCRNNCTLPVPPPSTTCGNGSVDQSTEQCDDGNVNAGDGCSAICATEPGYTCLFPGQPCLPDPNCGNGIKEGIEACDDGNTTAGDGCSNICATELGYTCTGQPSVCTSICGDGVKAGGEACDDGNTIDGDACRNDCTPPAPPVEVICGDGIVNQPSEACDDGNMTAGDGCSTLCATELGYTCTGQPSVCTSICGDGVKASGEACDDGNNVSGDGCENDCSLTPTGPGIDILQVDDPNPVTAGRIITYLFTVQTQGSTTAKDVTVTNFLPPGVTFINCIASQGDCALEEDVAIASLGEVEPEATRTVTVVVLAPDPCPANGLLTNETTVTANFNGNLFSATDMTTTPCRPDDKLDDPPDVAVIGVGDPDPVFEGGQLTYTLIVQNQGDITATNVTVTVALPEEATLEGCVVSSSPEAYCGPRRNALTNSNIEDLEPHIVAQLTQRDVEADIGDLGSRETATVTLAIRAPKPCPSTNGLLGDVTADADVDINPTNNVAAIMTDCGGSPSPGADVAITGAGTPDPVVAGQCQTYKLFIWNQGTSDTTNVTITDILPANITFADCVSSQGNCVQEGNRVMADLGKLEANATAKEVTLVVRAPDTCPPSTLLVNQATVNASGDVQPTNDVVEETTRCEPPSPGSANDKNSLPVKAFDGTERAYVMIGSPLNLPDPSPLTLLHPDPRRPDQTDFGRPGQGLWRLFRFDPLKQEYREFSQDDPLFDLKPGRGFWLITRSGGAITVEGTPNDASCSFPIQLQPGPNLIATPFNFAIDWAGCVVPQEGVSRALYGYKEGNYSMDEKVMRPMVGYWVFNETNPPHDVALLIDPKKCKLDDSTVALAATSQANPTTPSTTVGWRAKLSVAMGAVKDTENYLGGDVVSQDGQDPLDYPEPPPLHELSLSFPHPEWSTSWPHYTTDIRSLSTDAPQVWDFKIQANIAHAQVQLQWDVIGIDGAALTLRDVEGNRTINMGQLGMYTYDSGDGGVRHFQVTAR